jgi:hypothetical protein
MTGAGLGVACAAGAACFGADVMIESDLLRDELRDELRDDCFLAGRGAVCGAALTLTPSTVRAPAGRNVGASAAGPQLFGSVRMPLRRATALPSCISG